MWPNISGAYDFNRSYVSDPVSSFVPTSSVFDLPSQSLPFDSFLLLDWLGPLMSVQSLLYLFDYMYRILQTVRLIRTYWSTSAVKLPAVDTRLTKQKTGACKAYVTHRKEILLQAVSKACITMWMIYVVML